MALLSKSVIGEPEYHGKGHESTMIYYELIFPVTLHRSVGGSKVSLSEKIPQLRRGHHDLATEVLKGFSPGVFKSS